MLFDFPRGLLLLKAGTGRLVEDEATGNPLTFNANVSKPLKSLLIPFTPTQSGTGDPSPDNVRPIFPWEGVNLWHGGKNLFNGTSVINGYFSVIDGNTVVHSASSGRMVWIPCKPNTVYALSKKSGGKRLEVRASEEEPKPNTIVYSTTRISGSGTDWVVFRTPENARYICAFVWLSSADTEITEEQMISSVQIEVGDSVTTFEPYKPIETIPVSFPSGQTIYGGTLDLVTGVLSVEWFKKVFNGTEEFQTYGSYTGGVRFLTQDMDYAYPADNRAFSDKAVRIDANPTTIDRLAFRITSGLERLSIFVKDDTIIEGTPTIQTFKTWLAENGLSICARYETPQTIRLTPEQITALIGDNTIWSDTNGENTVVYLKKA